MKLKVGSRSVELAESMPLKSTLANKISRYYPEVDTSKGWTVADWVTGVGMEMSAEDIKSGKPDDCRDCAIGQMCQRHGLNPAITPYISYFLDMKAKLVTRASTPAKTRKLITLQDGHGDLTPQIVYFNAVPESARLGNKRRKPRGPHNVKVNPSRAAGLRHL